MRRKRLFARNLPVLDQNDTHDETPVPLPGPRPALLRRRLLGQPLPARAIAEWYPALVKPPLTPPAIAFPIAWSIIYLCIGIALGVALDRQRRELILPWAVQLALNFLWSILFFTLRCPPAGLVGLLLLDAAVILFTCLAARSCRPAAWLFAPYLAWLAVATYLNLAIWLLNA